MILFLINHLESAFQPWRIFDTKIAKCFLDEDVDGFEIGIFFI